MWMTSLLSTKDSKEEAEQAAQFCLDIVTQWAKSWKLLLKAPKVRPVSSAHTHWRRNGGQTLQWTPAPSKKSSLLGITLDRNLHFGHYVENVVTKVLSKLKMIGAVANNVWGW